MFMDFLPAGDLMQTINKFGRLSTSMARFYFSQVVLAFDYIH